MNGVQPHLTQARTNRDFLDSLALTNGNADWAIVVLFYTALHLVRAYIHQSGMEHGESHIRTNAIVRGHFPASASDAYLRLYTRSRSCRYDELTATIVEFNLLDGGDFQAVLAHVRTLLPAAM